MKKHRDNGMVKVEKGVAIPRPRNRSSYPWPELGIGDSFLVEGGKRSSFSNLLCYWSMKLDRKFVARTVEGGLRIWRTE